ncbi:MAG TPA: hypothetical protein VK468_02590 [Pyrinomonadaceae bacterium]|nr:hypothetical protein [Pyrinomonadaceae bacterium]
MKRIQTFVSALSILLAVAVGAAGTFGQTSPEMVVRAVYSAAKKKSPAEMSKAELRKYFDADLAGAIWKTANSDGGLDFDLLYNAQDARIRNFRITKASPQTAAVSFWTISFTNFGKKESFTFELTKFGAKGWRIADITYTDGSKLVDILKE